MGLLPLLDEESKFPQASDLSLAGTFVLLGSDYLILVYHFIL